MRADKALSDRVIIREHNKTLGDVVTGSTYKALSSDAKKAHGLNAPSLSSTSWCSGRAATFTTP